MGLAFRSSFSMDSALRTISSLFDLVWYRMRALMASEPACGNDDGARSKCPFAVGRALGMYFRTIFGVSRGNWLGAVMNPAVTARRKVDGAGYPKLAWMNWT
jgi:hypothetical protein